MKNRDKRNNKRNDTFVDNNCNNSFNFLNHSFQNSENKLRLQNHFFENIRLSNFKKSIFFKINQIQNNQQKTNIKLSSLISILLSKLIGSQNYKLFHNHFSIIPNKKSQNPKNKKDSIIVTGRIKTEGNQENKTERIKISNNSIKQKIENISLATESDIRRYNLSNHKTKSKENIFKLTDENQFNMNNKTTKNENEQFSKNSNNNLFRINYNNNYNSINKNSSTENLNNQKKIFNLSNNRKPITFNEIKSNDNYQNNNYYTYNKDLKKINSFNNNNNMNNYEKIYINASNMNYNNNNNKSAKNNNNKNNNSINKEKDFNKSNMSENRANKGQLKIKLNSLEKPILLMNFNDNCNNNNKDSINKYNNLINISDNSNPNEKKENKNYNNMIENKRLSLRIGEDSSNNINNLNYMNENGEKNIENIDSMRNKRKFSEARSEAGSVYSNLSDAKPAMGYSRKIRGFNFRNNIKFNKKPVSRKESEDDYNKIKGGSVRYINNNDFFGQIGSLENDCK